MSNITYINTQAIRKDLVGFLTSLESGQEVAVLNRSKVIARINSSASSVVPKNKVKLLLLATDQIQQAHATDHDGLGPKEAYKQRYYKDMAKKYGIS